MKLETQLSEAQKILVGGLKLLNLPEDNIIMVGLMLKSESQQMAMLNWLDENFKTHKMPTKEEVMDMAQYIMQSQEQKHSYPPPRRSCKVKS